MDQTTQGTKYADLLAQSKDQKDAAARQFDVEEAAQDLDATILATKRKVAAGERAVAEAKAQSPFNAQNILNKITELNDFKAGLAALEELKAELF